MSQSSFVTYLNLKCLTRSIFDPRVSAQGWQTLVNKCRGYMRLCTQHILRPSQDYEELTKTAMLFLEDLVTQNVREKMQDTRDAL
ncbi:hypothetical protein DTO271G3_6466 [Paecilomyces variotii]|nr:hypothetical protein DTO271G3_6466 [Paecilomyces variotii]